MKIRVFLAAILGLASGAAAFVAVRVHAVEASSSWLFAVFSAFFLVLAALAAAPARKGEPAPVRFAPSAFVGTVLLIAGLLVLLAISAFAISRLRR